jgi:glycosyltransferase involved in cell wall biosynthesis
MHELSFVIPIRIDTPDRLENCGAILKFLTTQFPAAEIQLVEQDRETQTAGLRASFPQVVWHFSANDKQFSRAAAINTGLINASRPYVCAYDTDILIDPEALRRSVALIRAGHWPIVIPFNLIFVELRGERRKKMIADLDISNLGRIRNLADVPRHPEIDSRVLSGAIMVCDRDLAVMEGGYNRKMVSYGWEDIEFFKRFEKLGCYSYMLSGFNLIHLDHRRGPDSRINEMYEVNQREFEHVLGMSVMELQCYVDGELAIAPATDSSVRRRLRRRRVLINWITLRRALHAINVAATVWRVNGTQELLRRVLRLSAPA